MKFVTILFLSFLICSPQVCIASSFYKATTSIHVRKGPGTKYAVAFTINKGDELEVLSRKGRWAEIKYQDRSGFVSARYLEFSRVDIGAPVTSKKAVQDENHLLIILFIGVTLFSCYVVYRVIRGRKLIQTVTELKRGTPSERDLVLKLLNCGFPHEHIFHDVYIKKPNGKFSQIDLVLVTKIGIIVFEVKDYSGWIFGNGKEWEWRQELAYGKQVYSFYNPILQNLNHLEELSKQLTISGPIPFYSVIVFYGNCEFKSINFIPSGTYVVKSARVTDVLNKILSENTPCVYKDKGKILRILNQAVLNGSDSNNQQKHIANIRDMLGSDRIFD